MSTDVQWYGNGFSGKERQQIIHRRLFNLLSKYGSPRDDGIVYDWMTHGLGWGMVSENEECIFASLAKAMPTINFDYRTKFDYEGGGLDQMYHTIQYVDGSLKLSTLHRFEVEDERDDEDYEEEDEEENEDEDDEDDEDDDWEDEEWSWHEEEDEKSISCEIDKTGNIIEDYKLSQKCLELEKTRLSDSLAYIRTETDDPAVLLDLGMICESGLAGIERDLTAAWDYYLKAAGTGDRDAIEFVRMVFADNSKEDFHELLAKKGISRESYPAFFDLAVKENNPELTAELLEYKASIDG